MTTSSAPGKIILFGEHAVVYGRPALAVPVTQVHAEVEILDISPSGGSDSAGIWIHAPDVNLHAELNTLPSDHPIASVIHNFLFLARITSFPSLQINISSTIPIASGLGSGTAVTVALARALSIHLDKQMTNKELNAFAYEIEKLYHGTPSGIDNTVVTYAAPVYFLKDQPAETFKPGKPFTIVIGDTGIPAPTKESVADVRRLWSNDRARWDLIFDGVADISFSARRVIEEGWVDMLGDLMNENHALLQGMTVSSPELDRLVSAARNAGAMGAKLSGGGRGGNMIALVEAGKADEVSSALIAAGAKRTITTQIT